MTAPVPVVIVRPPHDLGPVEVCVRHEPWGEVAVDVRPAGTAMVWRPIELVGGTFETRAS